MHKTSYKIRFFCLFAKVIYGEDIKSYWCGIFINFDLDFETNIGKDKY